MNRQVVEYLYTPKKGVQDIRDVFEKVLEGFLKDSILSYKRNDKDYQFRYDIVNHQESLYVSFENVIDDELSIEITDAFQNFLHSFNIEAKKSKLICSTLYDETSLFFSTYALPYLHKYEWSLRKLIYLLTPKKTSELKLKDMFSEEEWSLLRKKQRGINDNHNILQHMNLSDFETFLFGENYINIDENVVRFKELSSEKLLDLLRDSSTIAPKPFSLWEEIFNDYIDIEIENIQSDMKEIRNIRNVIGHNKELRKSEYQNLIDKLQFYIRQLELSFEKVLLGEIPDEEINNATEDIIDYIGLKGITDQISKSQLTNIDVESLIEGHPLASQTPRKQNDKSKAIDN